VNEVSVHKIFNSMEGTKETIKASVKRIMFGNHPSVKP
jgi:hypothetical protein